MEYTFNFLSTQILTMNEGLLGYGRATKKVVHTMVMPVNENEAPQNVRASAIYLVRKFHPSLKFNAIELDYYGFVKS